MNRAAPISKIESGFVVRSRDCPVGSFWEFRWFCRAVLPRREAGLRPGLSVLLGVSEDSYPESSSMGKGRCDTYLLVWVLSGRGIGKTRGGWLGSSARYKGMPWVFRWLMGVTWFPGDFGFPKQQLRWQYSDSKDSTKLRKLIETLCFFSQGSPRMIA